MLCVDGFAACRKTCHLCNKATQDILGQVEEDKDVLAGNVRGVGGLHVDPDAEDAEVDWAIETIKNSKEEDWRGISV